MEWINVKDRLPPKDGSAFLGYDPTKFELDKIYVLKYVPDNERYEETGGECYFPWEPTHWMPLPEAPKE